MEFPKDLCAILENCRDSSVRQNFPSIQNSNEEMPKTKVEEGRQRVPVLKHSWGAIWRMDAPKPIKGPISIRITSEGGKMLEQEDVIPEGWKPDTLYPSKLQF
jgi:hypothetical protein